VPPELSWDSLNEARKLQTAKVINEYVAPMALRNRIRINLADIIPDINPSKNLELTNLVISSV